MSDSFTGQLWRDIEDIYAAILAHPFVTGLADGTLPPEAFEFYVLQDALYLRKYAQALAAVGSRAPDTAATEMFARHAAGIVSAELELHRTLFAELGIDPASLGRGAGGARRRSPTPATCWPRRSTARTPRASARCCRATGSTPRSASTCSERGSPNPHYQQWIDTYGGDEFGDEAGEVIAVTDKLAAEITAGERERVRGHFRATSRYEWMFWDMGYRQERWPL